MPKMPWADTIGCNACGCRKLTTRGVGGSVLVVTNYKLIILQHYVHVHGSLT